ncbi:MAG: DNA topoisomerase IV subunit A [Sarcina sp.]
MVKAKFIVPKDNNIIISPIEEAMPDNYIPYAVEVAKERALPDVRDGLKPVHRRILYGAYMLKAFPDKPYYKSARIVGDILGKYHPHGDSSVYDAMVILAQDFSTRKPLIDGHGNWGSIDGDNAAAMRYTEARLSKISMQLMRDIEKDVVDMLPNYSDSELEPKVLPAKYPNLLVNGAFGIAVGLATNIPPHNLSEVIEGTLAYIDNNNITTDELMKHIKGPDLPTGGVMIGKNSLKAAYETGEGKVTVRAKAQIEKLENDRLGIVITEFPYRKNKAKILQTISDMTADKKHSKVLESIIDIRDESDRTGIRSVIEFKKSTDMLTADKVLKYLFKKTDLQGNISFNMVALADGKPETMGLKTIITYYVNHQKEVITRRTIKELEIAKKRFHVIEGFIKLIDILDDVITEIRNSKSKKDAHENLISKYNFTEIQADAILELMLYRLTGLEINVFKKEYKELAKKIKLLEKILSDEKTLLNVIKNELKEVMENFADERRTTIVEDDSEAKIEVEELIIEEDIMITISNDGFIKRIPTKNYKRSNASEGDIDYREGDYLKYLISSNTKDNLLIFTDLGNMYKLRCFDIIELKWKEKGERLDQVIKSLNLENEKIISIESIDGFTPNKVLKFITANATIKKTSLDKFISNYTKLVALKLKDGDKLIKVIMEDINREEKFLKIITSKGLEAVIEEPILECVDRNIIGEQLCNLTQDNKLIEIKEEENFQYAQFTLGVNKKGNIKVYRKYSQDNYIKTTTNSKEEILIFTDAGNVYKFNSYLVQNKDELKLSDVITLVDINEEVVGVFSTQDESYNRDDSYVYLYTKKGISKRVRLVEFADKLNNNLAIKFKFDDDRLIGTDISYSNKTRIILITKKGMAIKFDGNDISIMGRNASGVAAISLKDDEVVFAKCINIVEVSDSNDEIKEISNYKKIIVISKEKQRVELNISDMKLQNRAGRGNNIIVVPLEDYVKDISIK